MNLNNTTRKESNITCHFIFSTPIGDITVVYNPQPFTVKTIFLPRNDRKDLDNLIEAYGDSEPGSHEKSLIIKEQIIDYFKGKPIHPVWQWMDLSGLTKLQASVLTATADIPYGRLKSYKEIAVAIQRPRAYRFVGSTLAKNPYPILIPCHRVIRSDSAFGQFGGGTELKRKLIEMEALKSETFCLQKNMIQTH